MNIKKAITLGLYLSALLISFSDLFPSSEKINLIFWLIFMLLSYFWCRADIKEHHKKIERHTKYGSFIGAIGIIAIIFSKLGFWKGLKKLGFHVLIFIILIIIISIFIPEQTIIK